MKRFILPALIVALAAVLQFADLGDKSLWIDEVATVDIATEADLGAFFDAYERTERQPPLHHLMLFGWVQLAGKSDAALRVPSAAFAVGSVALAFWLGRLLAGRRLGLTIAYLFAISPFLLLYGRMARYFSTALFFALLSTIMLVLAVRRAMEGSRSGPVWIAYVGATFAMLMSSYPNAALFAGQAAFMILWLFQRLRSVRSTDPPLEAGVFRRLRNQWLASTAAVVLLFGVWLVVEWRRLVGFAGAEGRFQIKGFTGVLLDIVYPFYSYGLGETIFPWHPAGVLGLAVVVVAAIAGLRRLRELGAWRWLPLVLFAGAYLLTVASFQFFTRDLPFTTLPSRAISAFPFYMLIVALGIAALSPRLQAVALISLTVAASFAGWNYFTERQFHQPTYAIPKREMLDVIFDHSRPTDLIVADSDLDIDHYYTPSKGEPDLFEIMERRSNLTELQDERSDRIWLVTQGRDRTRGRRPVEIEAWLEANFDETEFYGFIPQDPLYSRIKERVQGFEDYRYKATVRLFERRDRTAAE